MLLTAACLLLAATTAPSAEARPAPVLSGEYLEVRTCDVYTGPCFANAEVNETGKEATLAWRIDQGSYAGVDLAGKSVVALIQSGVTLGKPKAGPAPLKTVLMLDASATLCQRAVLKRFALDRLGPLAVASPQDQVATIELETGCCEKKGCSRLAVAGGVTAIAIDTRCVCDDDKHCGNETAFYPPLTQGVAVVPAVAKEHTVRSPLFPVAFSDHERRGAFTGRFELAPEPRAMQNDDQKKKPAKAHSAPDENRVFEIERIAEATLPKDVPESFAKLLDPKGLRLKVKGGKAVMELWLRSELPLAEKPKTAGNIKYGQIPVGALVGAVHAFGGEVDYKDNPIDAGYYALRYGLQPEDGDHLGTAPSRDFFLLTAFKDDKDPAPIGDMEKLTDVALLATTLDHPMICHVRVPEGEAPKEPALKQIEDKHLWVLDCALPGKAKDAKEATPIRLGLVLIGVSDSL